MSEHLQHHTKLKVFKEEYPARFGVKGSGFRYC